MNREPSGNATRYQPQKTCPVCGERVKGLPYHITSEHGTE